MPVTRLQHFYNWFINFKGLAMWIYFVIVLILVAVAWEPVRKALAKKRQNETPDVPAPKTLSGAYGGRVLKPSDVEQKASFAESRRRGETNFGGGTNGGFYLEGAYSFVVDMANNISGEFILHGQRAKITGGKVNLDGTFSGSHIGGPFEGRITNGVIEGYVSEGGDRTWMHKPNERTRFIFGRLDGGRT